MRTQELKHKRPGSWAENRSLPPYAHRRRHSLGDAPHKSAAQEQAFKALNDNIAAAFRERYAEAERTSIKQYLALNTPQGNVLDAIHRTFEIVANTLGAGGDAYMKTSLEGMGLTVKRIQIPVPFIGFSKEEAELAASHLDKACDAVGLDYCRKNPGTWLGVEKFGEGHNIYCRTVNAADGTAFYYTEIEVTNIPLQFLKPDGKLAETWKMELTKAALRQPIGEVKSHPL